MMMMMMIIIVIGLSVLLTHNLPKTEAEKLQNMKNWSGNEKYLED